MGLSLPPPSTPLLNSVSFCVALSRFQWRDTRAVLHTLFIPLPFRLLIHIPPHRNTK